MTDALTPPACTARGRPRAISGEDRRTRVLAAAERVFITAGYHAATMNDVARTAGMSKRTLYQVFASKAALFEALLADRFNPLTLPLDHDDAPIAERLAGLLRHMAAFCLHPRQVALTRLMIAEALQSRDMADALRGLGIGRGGGILERWLAHEAACGRLRLHSAEEAGHALFFSAVGEALLHTLLQAAGPIDDTLIAQRIDYAVRLFLNDAAPAL